MLKGGEINKIRLKRDKMSHKGQNGQVLIIGGSLEYHGAPILAAWGAMATGVDLVGMAVPECNFEVTRSNNPELIVRKYAGEYLSSRALDCINNLAQKADCVLIGPGIGDKPETLKMIKTLIVSLKMPIVLDSFAIQALGTLEKMPEGKTIVITPHHAEMEKLISKSFKILDSNEHKIRVIRTLANDLKINILLKGPVDLIAAENGDYFENSTGNAGMTKGGTGDVLAGVVAGLIAQGLSPFDACKLAAHVNGSAGDVLFKEKGNLFSVRELIGEIPYLLKNNLS